MPNIPSSIMNKADHRTLLAAYRAECDVAEKTLKRLQREQDAVDRDGVAVFKALHKAAFAAKAKYEKQVDLIGDKITAAQIALQKAQARLVEVKNNLGVVETPPETHSEV